MASDSSSDVEDLDSVASDVSSSLDQVTSLITASSYLAGEAYAVSAVLAFKVSADANPTQLPF